MTYPPELRTMPLDALLARRDVIPVVNYGAGTDSTGMICELLRRGLPKRALFLTADTGSERPSFYKWVPTFSAWLEARGYQGIHVLRWKRKVANDVTGYRPGDFIPLHKWCLDWGQIPSAAFGMSGCSAKWKGGAIDPYIQRMSRELIAPLAATGQPLYVVRLFGFDAGEAHRHRDHDPLGNLCRSPLIEWDWGRDECIASVEAAGLPQPGKSSCWMCPHMKAREIAELKRDHPALFDEALLMERRWLEEGRRVPTLAEKLDAAYLGVEAMQSSVQGLGRNRSWASYTDEELAEALTSREDDNARPCGCMDG